MTTQPHATESQVIDFLGHAAPSDIDRLLVRASSLIDFHTHTAYTVDSDTGLATDNEVAAALADAVCAQIEFWVEVGEASNIDGLASTQQSVGGRSGYRTPPLAPRAHEALANAGLRRPNSGPLVETLP